MPGETITRDALTRWATAAGVAVEAAEALFRLTGHEIEPEVDELTRLVRQIGGSLWGTEADWTAGRYDAGPDAAAIRAGIEAARKYERRRILGDATIHEDVNGMRLDIPGRAFTREVSPGAVLYPLIRRLTGAE